jgi:hypothetical protein
VHQTAKFIRNISSLPFRKVSWLIKFETRKCSEVKDLTFVPLPWYLRKRISLIYPYRQIHSEYFNRYLTKQIEYSWKRQTKGIIYLASVLNNIRCNQTDISCLGEVFAKNTSLETKFPSPFGSGNCSSLDWYFSQIPSQTWYICS